MSTENLVLDEVINCSPTNQEPNQTSASPASKDKRSRSRSRSPGSNKGRQRIYDNEGTNTTSDHPHLQRARLFVGNVPNGVDRSDIKHIFGRYGEVQGVSIHKGYAFIQMDMERHANEAILGENGQLLKGTRLQVEFSQAAKKAGARFIDDKKGKRDRSPIQDRRGSSHIADELSEREAKLAKIIAMERELEFLRYRRPPPEAIERRRDYSPSRDFDRPRNYDKSRGYDRPPQSRGYDRPPQSRDFDRSPREYHRSKDYDRPPPKDFDRDVDRRNYYDPSTPSSISPPPRKFPRSGSPPKYGRQGEPSVGYGNKSSDAPPPPGWPNTGAYNKTSRNQRPWANEQWH